MISDKRKKAIHARLNSGYTLTDFEQAFTKAERSRFLRGGNKNNWQADFDWLMKDAICRRYWRGSMMTILERIMAEAKKADTTALSCEERMALYNSRRGDLTGYDCPICRNKGFVF